MRDGLTALKGEHKRLIEETISSEIQDSIDIDEAFRADRPQDNRWDYLLGHGPTGSVVALEPHSAKSDEIATVIAKRDAAMAHLKIHLSGSARVSRWLWVASGTVYFADTELARRRLDQNGIEFVGRRVLRKHLP